MINVSATSYDCGVIEALKVAFPDCLRHHISPIQWGQILDRIRTVNSDAFLYACGGECLCFFVTGFFCIFCFHPMISQSIRDRQLISELATINKIYFQSHPVMYSTTTGNILINISALPNTGNPTPSTSSYPPHYNQPIHQHPTSPYSPNYSPLQTTGHSTAYPQQQSSQAPSGYVTAYPSSGPQPIPAYATAYPQPYPSNPHITTPIPNNLQATAQYIVTTEVLPGSQVQVVSPSGVLVVIPVPKNAVPGDIIHYSY